MEKVKIIEKEYEKIKLKVLIDIQREYEENNRKVAWRNQYSWLVKMYGLNAFDRLLRFRKKADLIGCLSDLNKCLCLDSFVRDRFANYYLIWRFGFYHNENNFQEEIEEYLRRKVYAMDGSFRYKKKGEIYQSILFEGVK